MPERLVEDNLLAHREERMILFPISGGQGLQHETPYAGDDYTVVHRQ
ncbi:hypothetical protein Barb6_02987 [Bacteroidales bacterium Barb6]|nr:hypothetical protein Barb6_02987 [Bacteroidales bacterium Barb6]